MKSPIFTEAMLAEIIRFYGHSMQNMMGKYLEKNIQLFTETHNKLNEFVEKVQNLTLHLQNNIQKFFKSNSKYAKFHDKY